ncbi:Fe-S cluster assembly ATPase SufC [Candidatus Saccharibacteria bacterium]|nr:Fe-S cluster assembly ATPase SufC [Candidatus Saccharibacteria bacterium]
MKIQNLKVRVEGEQVVKGVTLEMEGGEIHALMGPNGSGKSTLALALAGHPAYEISAGEVFLGRKKITSLKPQQRAKAGLFLGFQHPVGVEGVSLFNFLKTSLSGLGKGEEPSKLVAKLKNLSTGVGLGEEFLRREVNLNFSGGEKKRSEVFQALVLSPRFAVFDEVDSGLDVDALKLIADKIRNLAKVGVGVLLITHYRRILEHLKVDRVHVMVGGRIVESGGEELAARLEKEGYKSIK